MTLSIITLEPDTQHDNTNIMDLNETRSRTILHSGLSIITLRITTLSMTTLT
jgi:hypothetical protein